MAAAILVAAPHPDLQRDVAAGSRGEAVLEHGDQLAGDQREEVARLRVRIDPAGPVAAVPGIAAAIRVAVREQHRATRALSAVIVTVKRAITSGRSGKKVMRRKPSASHWVQKLPPEV